MTAPMSTDPIAAELSRALKSSRVSQAIAPVLARVVNALSARPDEPQAWEPLALNARELQLPAAIQSCWIFVLRADAVFGAERHPNSHQRTIALSGTALFEVLIDGSWSARPIGGATAADAVSIPPSVWHRIRIGPQNFLSASFHTVPADQLIEETPVGDDLSNTRRRLYHA
jgi:hypothetical protein